MILWLRYLYDIQSCHSSEKSFNLLAVKIVYLAILLLKMYKPKKLVEKQQLNRTLTTSEQIVLFNYVLVFFKHTFFKHNILNTRSFGLTRYLKRLCVCGHAFVCDAERGRVCIHTPTSFTFILLLFILMKKPL